MNTMFQTVLGAIKKTEKGDGVERVGVRAAWIRYSGVTPEEETYRLRLG